MSKPSVKVSDLDFRSFNFTNPLRVDTALTLLSEERAVDFLIFMKANFPAEFISLILRNKSSSTRIAQHQKAIVPDGVVASLKITRQVFNNAAIATSSSCSFAVCDYNQNAMADFIIEACKHNFP